MVERHIVWSDAARDDLRAIVFHIAHDSPGNARDVAGRLQRRADALAALPARGRIVPELRRMGERRFREVTEGSWRILYLVEGSCVGVVAVVDGRRDVQAWLNEQAARFQMASP